MTPPKRGVAARVDSRTRKHSASEGEVFGHSEEFAMTTKRVEAAMEDGAPDKSGPRRMLNEKQVLEIVPVGRTTLYRMEKSGRFPRSTYISPNRRVWYED